MLAGKLTSRSRTPKLSMARPRQPGQLLLNHRSTRCSGTGGGRAGGSLASDEALQALRQKLTGGN